MIALSVTSPSHNAPGLLGVGASVPIGQSGIVTIWGRNDVSTRQQLGCRWVIRDPDGAVVEEYPGGGAIDWEWGYTGPGDEQDFIGGRFDLDKLGTYTIAVNLLMNPDSPVVVDSYEGDLCTTTTEVPPEYDLIQHTVYPWVYTFEGDAETCTFEFKLTPEQIPGTEWLGERIVNSFVSELKKEGSRLLELKVYRDITPTWWTNYRVEITATASPLAWNLIIIGVLAILFIVAIYFTIKLIDDVFFKRKPLSDETKATFSRSTLVSMILDLEPETPPETLAGKADQELRHLLNQILAEKAPPISWWPLAIVGGIAVLGIGAAVVLAAGRE
ncbi:hypothetical protein ES703_16678 [subsurface metagenome]